MWLASAQLGLGVWSWGWVCELHAPRGLKHAYSRDFSLEYRRQCMSMGTRIMLCVKWASFVMWLSFIVEMACSLENNFGVGAFCANRLPGLKMIQKHGNCWQAYLLNFG